MKRSISLIALSALLLTGCVYVPHLKTRGQVQDRLGNPADVRRDRNGDELWDYVRGPEGMESWRLRFDARGRVTEVVQLVTEERLYSLEPGRSTKEDVLFTLGRPSLIEHVGTGEVWSWRTKIHFDPGHLVVTFNPDGTVRERMALKDPILDDGKGN